MNIGEALVAAHSLYKAIFFTTSHVKTLCVVYALCVKILSFVSRLPVSTGTRRQGWKPRRSWRDGKVVGVLHEQKAPITRLITCTDHTHDGSNDQSHD